MFITAELLRNPPAGIERACEKQCAIVERYWPDGAETTVENLRKARRLKLDVAWLHRFIPAAARAEYEMAIFPALVKCREAECQRAAALVAWAEYWKAAGPALAARDAAWVEYTRARDAAWVEYTRARDAALSTALADA